MAAVSRGCAARAGPAPSPRRSAGRVTIWNPPPSSTHLDAVAVEIVVLAQLVERGAHLVQRGVRIQRAQLFER